MPDTEPTPMSLEAMDTFLSACVADGTADPDAPGGDDDDEADRCWEAMQDEGGYPAWI